MEITKDILIHDLVKENMEYIPVLMHFGMACIGCPAAQFETLEQAAAVHNVDVDDILEELKKV